MHGRSSSSRGGRTYYVQTRSYLSRPTSPGWSAVAFRLAGRAEAFDAELAAVPLGVQLAVMESGSGVRYALFTDSQAAMQHILNDSPGLGQAQAALAIRFARAVCQRGPTTDVRWVPGQSGVEGNEQADQWARGAAEGESAAIPGETMTSLASLRRQRTERAHHAWREGIVRHSQGRRASRILMEGARPRIRDDLRRAPKRIAARFFLLASDHAIAAPFLRERFGWISSDICWRCGSGRQTREHLFKECITCQEQKHNIALTLNAMPHPPGKPLFIISHLLTSSSNSRIRVNAQ